MRQMLEQRNFPAKKFRFVASKRSAGSTLSFRGHPVVVEELTKSAFAGSDLVIASKPHHLAAGYLPAAVEADANVLDESGYLRMKDGVALVSAEVNPQDALNAKGIIASPNCPTTQMVMALQPLHAAAGVKRVIVSTYQATSGVGVSGTHDLIEGTKAH